LVRMSEVRLLDLEGLLGLGDALALARDPTLEQAHALLHLRQLDLLLGEIALRRLQRLARLSQPGFPAAQRFPLFDLVASAGVALRAHLRKLRFESLARIRDEAHFGLDARSEERRVGKEWRWGWTQV